MSSYLDSIDKKMLNILSEDGRITMRELSVLLNISPPAVKKRYERLVKEGIIEGTSTRVNLKKIGFNLLFMSMVRVSDANHSVEIAEELMKLNEVLTVDIITGEYDIIFRGAVRDQDHLFELISEVQSIPHVERLFTVMIMKSMGEKVFHLS